MQNNNFKDYYEIKYIIYVDQNQEKTKKTKTRMIN